MFLLLLIGPYLSVTIGSLVLIEVDKVVAVCILVLAEDSRLYQVYTM